MSELLNSHADLIVFDKTQILETKSNKVNGGYFSDVLSADYSKLLADPLLKPLFSVKISDVDPASNTTFTSLINKALDIIDKEAQDSDVKNSLLVLAAVSALHLFIQSNFTGPALSLDPYQVTLDNGDLEELANFNTHCIDELASDGETVYLLTSYPHLLLMSNAILKYISQSNHTLTSVAKWWYARSVLLQQSIIDSSASSLHEIIFTNLSNNVLESILSSLSSVSSDSSNTYSLKSNLAARFYMELARAQLLYDYDSKAEHSLKLAQQATGFQFVLTGFKAKRTKFQEFETSQMIFIAKSKIDKVKNGTDDHLPISLELNSELLLEKVSYSTPTGEGSTETDSSTTIPDSLKQIDPNNQPGLQDIDTAITLLRQTYVRSSSPYNNPLVQEELLAIANRIINSPEGSVNWSLYSRALWERSVLESSSPKTVERGTLQMQSLVEELGQSSVGTYLPKPQDERSINVAERMSYIHQIMPMPKWSMDSKLAEKFMSIGVLKSALEVYERLQMWDQVALCYSAVGQDEKAKEILFDHLEKKPKDARSWTILGEITQEPQYLEKAWEVGKFASARRTLGKLYYSPPTGSKVERDVERGIRYMHEALTVNPLHYETWFTYGCAGLETEQYDLAAEAFTRCVALDDSDGKSWSNLSTALLRLNKKGEAFNALKRAVRVTSDKKNWRIWSNYVTVAVELSEWNEVLRGTRELLTIKGADEEQYLDVSILEHLCQILVSTKYPEANEEGEIPRLDFFQKSAIELFINSIPPLITSNPRLWKIVARVELWRNKPWASLEAYEKGFRIYTHLPTVETEEKIWNEAVEYCGDLVDAYSNLGPRDGKYGDGSVVCSNWKFKAKSAVRVLIGRGKKWWEDSEGWEKLQSIKEDLVSL